MSQLITTPDGVEHEFPDAASDEVIKKALGSYTSGNLSPDGGNPPAASAPTAQADSPSFLHRMLSGWAQQPRILNNAATGGLWDVGVGGLGSLLGLTSVRGEQAKTDQARAAVGGPASTALDVAGTLIGPGKLSTAGKVAGLLPRMAASGLENATLAGGEAALKGEDVTGAAGKAGIVGAAGPVIGGIAGQAASLLPEALGGKVAVPTAAGILASGGGKFMSGPQTKAMDKLNILENMQKNADTGGATIPGQVGGYLNKDLATGISDADTAGFTDAEQKALAGIKGASPVSGFMQRHPILSHGAFEAAAQIPALALGASGNVEHALQASGLGVGAHIGSYVLASHAAEAARQAAFDDARRMVGGVSTANSTQDALNNPEWRKALQALMFSGSRP